MSPLLFSTPGGPAPSFHFFAPIFSSITLALKFSFLPSFTKQQVIGHIPTNSSLSDLSIISGSLVALCFQTFDGPQLTLLSEAGMWLLVSSIRSTEQSNHADLWAGLDNNCVCSFSNSSSTSLIIHHLHQGVT